MKKIVTFLLLLFATSVFAQDPDVSAEPITGALGAPPFLSGEQVSFELMAGSNSGNLIWPPPGNAPFSVAITTNNILNIQISVSGTNYFSTPTITDFGGGIFVIEFEQIMTIPDAEYTFFTISGYAIGPNGTTVGYQANGNPGGYNTTNAGLDAPSSFAQINGTMPVRLLDFNVKPEGRVAHLKWSTAEETGSDYFQIQHSLDAKNWSAKSTVNAAGDSKVIQQYNYSDGDVANGINYYRLKIVDKDGTYSYSKVRSVEFDGIPQSSFSVFPNPAVNVLNLESETWDNIRKVSIIDITGKEVISKGNFSDKQIDVSSLVSGTYSVKVFYSNQTQAVKRVVVIK